MELLYTDEPPSFETIYRRNAEMVYRLCFSYLKTRSDAEDAAQTTFLKLLGTGKTFASTEHEKAWLIVTATNVCRNALRHWWRRRDSLDACEPAAAPEVPETRELFDAILALPPRCKTVVYLYYYEGYRTEEIARMLGRPVSTVRNQLSEARKKLKTRLEDSAYVE